MPVSRVAFPDFDKNSKWVNQDGTLTDSAFQSFHSLFTQAVNNFSEGGTSAPELEGGTIARQENGVMQYNTTDDEFQIYKDNTLHNVSTTVAENEKLSGMMIPKIDDVNTHENPEIGLIVYDTSDDTFKGYTAGGWVALH